MIGKLLVVVSNMSVKKKNRLSIKANGNIVKKRKVLLQTIPKCTKSLNSTKTSHVFQLTPKRAIMTSDLVEVPNKLPLITKTFNYFPTTNPNIKFIIKNFCLTEELIKHCLNISASSQLLRRK